MVRVCVYSGRVLVRGERQPGGDFALPEGGIHHHPCRFFKAVSTGIIDSLMNLAELRGRLFSDERLWPSVFRRYKGLLEAGAVAPDEINQVSWVSERLVLYVAVRMPMLPCCSTLRPLRELQSRDVGVLCRCCLWPSFWVSQNRQPEEGRQ